MTDAVAAVDLGATSGRVILGHVGPGELHMHTVARFPNGPVQLDDGLHWDLESLYARVLEGLASAIRDEPELRSIGIDAWAVDYALMSGDRMLRAPFHYRDERTLSSVAAVHSRFDAHELYLRNGLQHLAFNTVFQLEADRSSGALDAADRFLLIPDLLTYRLTGVSLAEKTNASTTGLLGVSTGEWDDELIERLCLPRAIFPDLVEAGTIVAPVLGSLNLGGTRSLPVSTVGSHDTASAVVGIPSTSPDVAFISCGTWGLVGVELDHPVLTEAGRIASFTNERGVGGRFRYLHNVMGLWLLSESVRTWEADGPTVSLPELIDQAASVKTKFHTFDTNDPRFNLPGDMPARVGGWYSERGFEPPRSRAETVRCIIESLADAFARAVHDASSLSGKSVAAIHLVGGGSQNRLLCQLTADRSGLPVFAGPVEATAIGNVLVQARADGILTGSLESLRELVAATFPPTRFDPRVRTNPR